MIAIGTKVRSLETGRPGVISSRHECGDFTVMYPTNAPGVSEFVAYGKSEVGTSDDHRALIEIIDAEEPEMTHTTPDPATVREIAKAAHRSTAGSDAERVETALIAAGVAGPVFSERFDIWTAAVAVEYERLANER